MSPKAVINGVLASHTVAMVSYYATKMITTYSPMVRQYFDTMIVASNDSITTHQHLSAGNCFEPP